MSVLMFIFYSVFMVRIGKKILEDLENFRFVSLFTLLAVFVVALFQIITDGDSVDVCCFGFSLMALIVIELKIRETPAEQCLRWGFFQIVAIAMMVFIVIY